MQRRCAWGLVVVWATLVGCSGKERPFGEGVAGSSAGELGGAGGTGSDATT